MWFVNLLLLSLAPGCFSSKEAPETEATAPDPEKKQKKARKPKRPGQAGARKRGPKRGPSFDPNVVYGAAGPVTLDVALEQRSVNGKLRTGATLHIHAGEKSEKVRLGNAPGPCEVTDPVKVDAEHTALWTASCDLPKGKTLMSISQQDGLLVVTRGKPEGKHLPVRKLKLAEGAEVSVKKPE